MNNAPPSCSSSPEGSLCDDSIETTATDQKVRQLFAAKSNCIDDLKDLSSESLSESTRGQNSHLIFVIVYKESSSESTRGQNLHLILVIVYKTT